MAGGLIQLVTSGQQDVSLTYNPEITFFKKMYKKHTNFSIEIKEIYTDQQPNYGDSISFNLDYGDLVYRCFIQVELPTLIFDDSTIKNSDYLLWKQNYIKQLDTIVLKWSNLYINLKNYVSIELLLYQQLLVLFLSDNITLNNIKEVVIKFNNLYKSEKLLYSNLIDTYIFNKINISGYLLSINKLLTYDDLNTNSNYISINTIKNILNTMYLNIQEYLLYYHTNWRENQKIYDKFMTGNINFAWSQYLGHFYFSKFELSIGGQVIEQYTSNQLHIYQYHHLLEEQINNYNILIGHDSKIYTFNSDSKPSKILLIPLIFFFNKNAGSSIPLIAMRNTSIIITLTINKLKNLLYFRDWETEYNNYCIITTPYTSRPNINLNYSSYNYNSTNKQLTYKLININYEALSIIYPQLNNNDINFILTKFGNNNILELNDWIYFKNNINNYTSLQIKINGYDNYINFNYLLNLVPKPKIKLLIECVFLDDIERKKFTSSKLEYVIESFQENNFDVNNLQLFNGEISINRPNKYLTWFIQPKNFLYGLSEYGKVTPYNYNYSLYYKNKIFINQTILFNQIDLLNEQLDQSYYNLVQPFKTFNRSLPDEVYIFNFALYPEEVQPSGTINLSVLSQKQIRYEFDSEFLTEYFSPKINANNVGLQITILSSSYNFLVVNNGIGRILFAIS